jgi:crotonobetainyl-CoA:carnitine CoA-transferase CaiB-like acyl-CoA transferase
MRVVEVALLAPDALGMHLADLGAEVIKVEEPGRGDYVRLVGRGPGEEVSPLHFLWNRGKRSVILDLRVAEAAAAFRELVAVSDVVVEGLRPGALARRGLGPDQLQRVNPRLVFASLSGFGQTGPYRDLPSHGVGFDAYAGLADPVPGPEGWPSMPGGYTQVGILAGPLYAAMAVLAGVIRARATGEGCVLDVAESDCAVDWQTLRLVRETAARARDLQSEVQDRAVLNASAENVRYQSYATADGRHVMLMPMAAPGCRRRSSNARCDSCPTQRSSTRTDSPRPAAPCAC